MTAGEFIMTALSIAVLIAMWWVMYGEKKHGNKKEKADGEAEEG